MLLEEGGADLDEELGAAQAEGLQVGAAEKLRVEFLVLDQAAAKLLFCGVRSDFFSLFRCISTFFANLSFKFSLFVCLNPTD